MRTQNLVVVKVRLVLLWLLQSLYFKLLKIFLYNCRLFYLREFWSQKWQSETNLHVHLFFFITSNFFNGYPDLNRRSIFCLFLKNIHFIGVCIQENLLKKMYLVLGFELALLFAKGTTIWFGILLLLEYEGHRNKSWLYFTFSQNTNLLCFIFEM